MSANPITREQIVSILQLSLSQSPTCDEIVDAADSLMRAINTPAPVPMGFCTKCNRHAPIAGRGMCHSCTTKVAAPDDNREALAEALERISDMLGGDDGQAAKEARKFLERNQQTPTTDPVSREAAASETLLAEAAQLFRTYEAHHRAKIGEIGRPEKAERNAEIAGRIEAHLAAPNGMRKALEQIAASRPSKDGWSSDWHLQCCNIADSALSPTPVAGGGE